MFKSALDEGFKLMFWSLFLMFKMIWNIIVGLMNVKKAADYQARRGGR